MYEALTTYTAGRMSRKKSEVVVLEEDQALDENEHEILIFEDEVAISDVYTSGLRPHTLVA